MNGHIKILWNPTRRQLRQFGLTALVALPALAWLWSRGSGSIVLAAALAGAAIAALGFVWPQGLRPLFVGLSLLAWPIGVVVHELCLLVIYYVVFVPLGLVFRCMGATRCKENSNAARPPIGKRNGSPVAPPVISAAGNHRQKGPHHVEDRF